MAKFCTTAGIAHGLEELIIEAQQEIILVSAYVQIHKLVMQRLRDAAARNVSIKLVYRVDARNTQKEVEKLSELPTLQVYSIENLHAKCFMNEHTMLISSMNLYHYSEKNNREMGISLTLQNDGPLFTQAREEVRSILRASTVVKQASAQGEGLTKQHQPTVLKPASRPALNGHCISCRKSIKLCLNAPYCKACYLRWAQVGNALRAEQYCACCGLSAPTTRQAPFCYQCWQQNKKQYTRPKLRA